MLTKLEELLGSALKLQEAVNGVLENWESGDLALAVRELSFTSSDLEDVMGQLDAELLAEEPLRVVVEVSGGLVSEVKVPDRRVVVEIHDYDTDGTDEKTLVHDESGDSYHLATWTLDQDEKEGPT